MTSNGQTGPKRSRSRRRELRSLVAQLYHRRLTYQQIAARLGLTVPMVERDIAALTREWRERAAEAIDAAKARELAELDELAREAWDAWERSKADAKRKRAKRVSGSGAREETSLDSEERVGEACWLELVLTCHRRRCELMGLTQRVLGGRDDPVHVVVAPLSDQEKIERFRASFEPVLGARWVEAVPIGLRERSGLLLPAPQPQPVNNGEENR